MERRAADNPRAGPADRPGGAAIICHRGGGGGGQGWGLAFAVPCGGFVWRGGREGGKGEGGGGEEEQGGVAVLVLRGKGEWSAEGIGMSKGRDGVHD